MLIILLFSIIIQTLNKKEEIAYEWRINNGVSGVSMYFVFRL